MYQGGKNVQDLISSLKNLTVKWDHVGKNALWAENV